ncbi:microtubule-associated serine/threonine-protein kinase 4-like [Ranitomeya variabilis]|uniref:microtubule-associated serine/threonine-protein kinase 4-like n=1 Tax=Ranitomeya variabilis TaxID=490064 RepID=UPI004055ADB0
MAELRLNDFQVQALWEILIINHPDIELLPPDGILCFTHRLVVQLVKDCLTKNRQGQLTSEYLTDLRHNIKTLLHQAEKRSQYGDLAFIKQLAEKVLCVLEGPARSSERPETPEGDDESGEYVTPETSDPDRSQPELSSDLMTEPSALPNPDSGNCEIPEKQESAGETPEGDEESGEYVTPPETSDSNRSQPEPSSDLMTEPSALANPDSVICEIPKIQESAGDLIRSLIPAGEPRMSDYETSKLISRGAFGSIHLVRHKDSQKIFAMKKMAKQDLNTPEEVEDAYLERDILTFADCPFVVSMLCSFPTRSHLCMVMEYIRGGDCETLLSTKRAFSVPLARMYFAEAVLGVEYLHSYGVVHRDLKPANLLITSTGHIKITDFGLSKIGVMIPNTNIYKRSADDISREFLDCEASGTPDYKAPEVILTQGYGRPVDWWAMGIILHEFVLGSVPFEGDTLSEFYENVVTGDIIWNSHKTTPPDFQDLITQLLRTNPVNRLGTGGAFEIKDHPFLSDLDFDTLLSQKPLYIPRLASDVDTSLFINHSNMENDLVSEDEKGTSEDNDNLDFNNFTSSTERLAKLRATVTRMKINENSKSSTDCTLESSTDMSEMQKESVSVADSDGTISILPSSSPISAQGETKSTINLSKEEEKSENGKKGKKRRGSILRRFLSSCRRGLSRAARIFACCHCCPRTI